MRSKCFIQILALLLLLLVIVFSFRRLVNKVIIFYRSLLRISCTDSWGEKEERKRCRTPMDLWRNQPPSPRKLSAGGICIGIFSLSAGFLLLLPPPLNNLSTCCEAPSFLLLPNSFCHILLLRVLNKLISFFSKFL